MGEPQRWRVRYEAEVERVVEAADRFEVDDIAQESFPSSSEVEWLVFVEEADG